MAIPGPVVEVTGNRHRPGMRSPDPESDTTGVKDRAHARANGPCEPPRSVRYRCFPRLTQLLSLPLEVAPSSITDASVISKDQALASVGARRRRNDSPERLIAFCGWTWLLTNRALEAARRRFRSDGPPRE